MKRIILTLLTIALLLSLAACGTDAPQETTPSFTDSPSEPAAQPTQTPAATPEPTPEPEALFTQMDVEYTLSDKLPAALAEHIKEQRKSVFVEMTDAGKALFNNWLDEGPTPEMDEHVAEIVRGLIKEGAPETTPEFVSKEDARFEIEFMFDFMKCAYGGYGVFGGDAVFLPIRDEMLAKLDGLTQTDGRVDIQTYNDLLAEPFAPVIVDQHFRVGDKHPGSNALLFYAYSEELIFHKDGNSFITTLDGKEYSLVSVAGELPESYIKATILEDGSFAYVLGERMMAEAKSKMDEANGEKQIDVLLQNEDGDKHVSVTLKTCDFAPNESGSSLYRSYEKDGVMVLENRAFEPFDSPDLEAMISPSEMQKFKDQNTVVIDAMSNHGGSTYPLLTWLGRFLGYTVEPFSVAADMQTRTVGAFLEYRVSGTAPVWDKHIQPPKQKKNDTVTFLLMGYNGSAGEMWTSILREADNVILVGLNSEGNLQFGRTRPCYLPHSKLLFQFGTSLNFMNQDFSQFECVGFEPDLWVPPLEALERVIKFIERYGINDQ